jgi:RNA polymerase sigma factor (sigma-70 family)
MARARKCELTAGADVIRRGLLRNSPESAFETLYRRHVKDVFGYSLAMLDRQADAEDATQTTFMNAYRALERGERPRDSGKWLRAIALNVCREHYRRAGRRPNEVSLEEDPGDLVLDPPTPEIGDVIRGLSALPFNQRAALVMREFEGRSLNEIASELDVSSSAVEALLFRARRALREQLEGSLTCTQAEDAISRQLDGALPRAERGPLRAHLRECSECASLARRLRAQRRAVRSLAVLLPLPESLRWGKLAAAATTSRPIVAGAGSLLGKAAVMVVAGAATVGVGYAALHGHHPRPALRPGHAAVAKSAANVVVVPRAAVASHYRTAIRGRRPLLPVRKHRRRVNQNGFQAPNPSSGHPSPQAGGAFGASRASQVAPRGTSRAAPGSRGHAHPTTGGSHGRSSVSPGHSNQRARHAPGHARGKGHSKPAHPSKPASQPSPLGKQPGTKKSSGVPRGNSGTH